MGTGNYTYAWDAEGRLKSVTPNGGGSVTNYVYDGLGQRVEKNVGGTYTEILYDAFGQTLAYHNRSTWTDQFFCRGAAPFAKYQGNETYSVHAGWRRPSQVCASNLPPHGRLTSLYAGWRRPPQVCAAASFMLPLPATSPYNG